MMGAGGPRAVFIDGKVIMTPKLSIHRATRTVIDLLYGQNHRMPVCLRARTAIFLLFGFVLATGCMLFDVEEDLGEETIPVTGPVLNASCTDLWKHYTDELQLINDDEANWASHDDAAVQYVTQFSGNCNIADTREATATELRCKALWNIYMQESGRMAKDDRTWREHDLQQVEAMNRIRNNCTSTACKFLPGVRCLVPTGAS